MSKVLIEVLIIILIAGSYLILYSAVRVSAIADQRIAEIQKRETFDKEKQLNTNQSSISGGMAMANKEKKIEGRLGYNSENGRYGLLVSDLWEHTGFHCELCGKKHADLYEVHVVRNINELGNSDWELAMKAKRRKTLVVCSDCHRRIHK